MPDEERQHTVCRYADNRQPGVFQGEIPKGDTGVLPKGGRFPHWPGNHFCSMERASSFPQENPRFVDTLITASPEFFKKKSPKEIQEFFQRAADFLIGRVGKENIVSAVVHMDEKTPHLHLTFVPLTKDNRLCAKEIIGNRANLTKPLFSYRRSTG